MNAVKLFAFIFSFSFLYSLIIAAVFYLLVKWMDNKRKKQFSQVKEPPFIPMNDPEILDDILSFYPKTNKS